MKQRILTILTLLLCFAFTAVNAQVITAERAAEIANSFFSTGMQKSAAARGVVASPSLTSSFDSNDVADTASTEPTFYVLTNPEGGFVIVSGEEIENPIIGYSMDGTIDVNNLPDGFVDYMTDIDAQVKALREYNAENPQKSAASRSAMQRIADYEYNATAMGEIVVDLKTAPWGQNSPFNKLCPVVGTGNAVTGCVPTAYSILCRYYEWPEQGVGTVYNPKTGDPLQLGHTYDYASMRNDNYPSGYTDAEATAVATLMRDMGYAYTATYGSGTTTTSNENPSNLIKYFGFKCETPLNHGNGCTKYELVNNMEQWVTYIKNCLNAGYPIPYSSTIALNAQDRHIYILDGYTDNNYFHFNWGWKGQGNGWFTLDNMVPDNTSNYSNSHRAYFNVIPDKTTYPVTATVNDSNMGAVSINGGTEGSTVTASLIQGVTATLTAHPVDGYALANWTKGGEIVGTRSTLQVPVGTSDNDYVANFDDEANVLAIKDYVVNTTNGSLNNGSSKSSIWTSTDNQPTLTLKTTADNDVVVEGMSVYEGNHKFYATAYDVNGSKAYTNVTYTLSVPEGYVIKDYTMTYNVGTANQISLNGELLTSTGTFELSATPNAQTASFTLSVSSVGQQYITSESIAVTVQSEGGGSTPTPDPEPDPTPTTYTVTTTANPVAGGTAKFAVGTGSQKTQGDVENGTQITLYATANTGYNFVNWTLGGNVVSTDATCNVSVAQTANYVANFEVNETPTQYPTPTGTTYTNNYLTSVTTTGANENISYTANAHPGVTLVTVPGTVRVEQGESFTLNLVAKSLSSSTSSVYEDMRYCHASLFTDFDGDRIFGAYAQSWGEQPPTNNVAGNYSSVMNITHEITVPADAPLGTSHVRMVYTNAWKVWPTNGTTELDKGIVYDIVVEVVEPSNEETLNVTFGELWSAGDASQIVTKDSPAVTITEVNGANKIGYSTKNDGKHPFLLKGGQFKISVPAPYKIASYTLVAEYVSFNAGTVEYTDGRESTATATISNGTPSTLSATGLNNSEIIINLGNAQASPAGLIITSLAITYVEDTNLETYTVSVTAGENGTATASATTVTDGDNVTLTATANTGYKFVGWYNGETKVSETNPYTFAVTSNISYEARFEELFPDGAYKIHWEHNERGYLAYHSGENYNSEARLADVTLGNWGGSHYNSSTDPVDLVWYLITAGDGQRYLFHAATGKFLGANETVNPSSESKANKLSTSEALPIRIEENTACAGHYVIRASVNGEKNAILSSGCATASTATPGPVRWWWKNYKLDDGGSPLKLIPVNDVTVSDNVMNAVRAVIEPRTFKFKAEIENWRNDNPNTHLGTITIGGTPLKLTPEHRAVSELTMALNEGTTLAFTRKYRGFEFNGFYIGATELGENPTLNAENVAAIDEETPLVAKFTATDDVTLFYDDDEFSYRIPAIAKTSTNRLVAISDYRHSHDDIGRDNHGTGTLQVDLVMRTSDNNGLTWSAKQTIAEGNQNFGYGDAAVAVNGENILVMAVAGNVFFTNATSSNKQRTYRIYSADNGITWEKEEVSSNLYSLFPNANGMFFGSGKLVVDPNFNNSGNARVYGAMLLNDGSNYVVYSDNWGETWSILGGGAAASANEPKVEILPNGQILLSSRRNGGRTFNVFTYTDKANNAGTWSTATNGCNNGGNGTNGEIICLDAKRLNGKPTKILLQSQPNGSDRRNVSIWYKEISADETYTGTSIASDWTMGKQVSTQLSAYSAMCLQANGEIALFFEEAPCHNDDATYGYSMVYVPLTIEEATADAFLNPNADIEYVPVEFNIELTDAEGNIYRETLDYVPSGVAAVESYLTTTYPFITLGTTGAIADNTYTNTVTLPFKVSNANTTVWHNIYWPANTNENLYPIYMLADKATDTQVAKVNTSTQYGNSQYNTLEYADKLSWAIYSVGGTLNFKLKNKVTQKYIKVTSIGTGNEKNAVYAEDGEATAFTLQEGTGSRENSYNLIAKVGETTGYLCSTSVGNSWATHYNGAKGNDHHGAWVKFVEAPDYQAIVDALEENVAKFGEGDGNYTDNTDINAIKDIIENIATTPLNTLNTHTNTVQTVKDSYTEITLTVPAVNDVVPGSVMILDETVSHKFVPKGNVTIKAVPAAGYRFVNWTRPAAAQASAAARTAAARNSNVVSDQNPYTVTVSEALSLEANFEEIVVTAILKDERENIYNVTLNAFAGEINQANVEAKLLEKYPYIEFGNEVLFNATTNTYSNRIVLPFKVSNSANQSSDNLWHNIYYPANSNDNPNYIAALDEDVVVDMAASGSHAYGANPTYNTMEGNPSISWAIYNVNESFEFIFKNEFTGNYIKVESVSNSTTQNVKFVENAAEATAFTLLAKETVDLTGVNPAVTGDCDFALVANVDNATGYLCATSSSTNYLTHFNRYNHRGAWVKFAEANYVELITTIGGMLDRFFVPGNNKHVQTAEIQAINEAFGTYENPTSGTILLNTLKSGHETIVDAIDNWPLISVSATEGGSVTINNESVSGKKAPVGHPLPIAATPAEGYSFVNWTKDAEVVSTNAVCTYTVEGATTLTANFAKNSYTVSVTAGEGGSAIASAATAGYGSEVTLTAEENDGYEFVGWYNGETKVSDANPYTFAVTSDINYTARFNQTAVTPPATKYAIHVTVASTDDSVVTNNADGGNVKAIINNIGQEWATDAEFVVGADVELVATNDYDQKAYLFDGWYKNDVLVSKDLEITVRATETATYEARFFKGCTVNAVKMKTADNIQSQILGITLEDDTSIGYDASRRAVVKSGTTVKINTEVEDDYKVIWQDANGIIVSEKDTLVVTVNEDVTYYANFLPDVEVTKYYRFAYDFSQAQPAPAARTAATRAVGDEGTYVVNGSTGTVALDRDSKTSRWSFIPNGDLLAELTLEATANVETATTPQVVIETKTVKAIKVDGDYLDLCVGGWTDDNRYQPNRVTFTLSVNSEYKIVRYSIRCKAANKDYNLQIIPQGRAAYDVSKSSYETLYVDGLNDSETTFELNDKDNGVSGKVIYIDSFEVYIQEVGGGETPEPEPEPEPETSKHYIQSAPVSNEDNALKMTIDTTAASVFYYDGSKLMSYANGKFVNESAGKHGLQAYGAENAGIFIITENEGQATIAIPAAEQPYYLHAAGTSDNYYVSNCSNNATCMAHTNFIIEEVTSLPVTISSVGYATFFAPVAVNIPANVTAYYLAEGGINGNYAYMESIGGGVIPANTGVILEGAEGIHYFDIIEDYDGETVDSYLAGTVAAEYIKEDAYVLSTNGGGVENIGFYKAKKNESKGGFLNNSHKSYLPASLVGDVLSQGSNGFRLVFGTTAIEEVEAEKEAESIYDLSGRKLEGIYSPGVYIVNGKKVLVK